MQREFVKKWLILAVMAIAGAGIYSLPPVIFRGPVFKDILPVEAIFASSLVIHVDLSVLVWLLAIGGMLWSQFYDNKYHIFYKATFYTAAIGTALIAISPLTGNLNPLKNNYIPVLQNPVFFIGLALFASAVALQIIITLLSTRKMLKDPLGFGLFSAAAITVVAFICFIIAGMHAPIFDHANPTIFYESLFWGGGHVLQASFTTLLIAVWFILLSASGYQNPLPARLIYILFGINLITALPTPFFYLSDESVDLFAKYMRDFLGISPLVAGGAIIYTLLSKKHGQADKTIRSFLALSILLFGYGGVLAYMISGVNVTIPAHYHGSIVGTSIAFMGLVYHFMPKAGFNSPSGFAAKAQPYVYGIGQAMHITGLAVMGGYGALRKDAASSQHIDTVLGKALFFSGGSFAILGGLMFVVVVLRAMQKEPGYKP